MAKKRQTALNKLTAKKSQKEKLEAEIKAKREQLNKEIESRKANLVKVEKEIKDLEVEALKEKLAEVGVSIEDALNLDIKNLVSATEETATESVEVEPEAKIEDVI